TGRDPGAGPDARLEHTLGDQLLVHLGDDPARDPELLRQPSAGGQRRPGVETSARDGVAQRTLEPGDERPVAAEVQQGVADDGSTIGLVEHHEIGPYTRTDRRLARAAQPTHEGETGGRRRTV